MMTIEDHNQQVEAWSESVKNLEFTLITAQLAFRAAIRARHNFRLRRQVPTAVANQIETLRAELDDARHEVAALRQQLSGLTCASE